MKTKLFFAIGQFLLTQTCLGQQSATSAGIVGHWQGNCKNNLFLLHFSIDIIKKDTTFSASYNSDEQRALNIPLYNVKFNKDSIHFILKGDNDSWIFNGKVRQGNISGLIKKGNQSASFSLEKKIPTPVNYKTTEVTFVNDTVVLSGTLFMPNAKGKAPAILFLHGSGGEQRFASSYMADYLVRKGIAVLIYDKRGAGKSTGNWANSSFRDLAKDAIAGIKLLQNNPNINSDKIGIYGHSQGGSICPMLLDMYPKIAFGISAASAGVSMAASDKYELQNSFKNIVSGDDYKNAMEVLEKYLHFALTRNGYDDLMAEAKKFGKEKWYQENIGDIDTSTSFFHTYPEMGSYNPVEYWKMVKQPVLILKGANDETAPGYPSFQNIENALKLSGNNKYKIVIFPNTTHGMHIAGHPNDFFFFGTPGYCDTIFNWIKQDIIER